MSRFKSNLLGTLVLAMLVAAMSLTACGQQGSTASAAGVLLEQRSYPLVLQKSPEEEAEQGTINLYFADGEDVPYVAVTEYMPLFGSLYENDASDAPALEFTISRESNCVVAARTDGEQCGMMFDPAKDIISFVDYNSFMQIPGGAVLVPVVTIGETGWAVADDILQDVGSYDRKGLMTEFDLAAYDIDIVEKDGECYVPLQTMSDILLAYNCYRCVFNGEKVFVYSDDCEPSDQINAVPAGQMSEGFARFNFNELLFLLDYFYGLKPEHNIDDFYSLVTDAGLYQKLSSTDPQQFDEGLRELINLYLDDAHSAFMGHSYLVENKDDDSGAQRGASVRDLLDTHRYRLGSRLRYYPDLKDKGDSVYLYEEVGDTAIVTFDGFTMERDDYHKEVDLEHPSDTIELIAHAHERITREDSPIKNVVIDLSCNVGGSDVAGAYVISWLVGARQLALRDTLTGAQSVCLLCGDTNLDGAFDENDTLWRQMRDGELNLYCLISPASFSCGNLVPTVLKGSGVTLIGEKTGGGSCVGLPCSSACGTQFQISGTNQLSSIVNGSFYNADGGVEPDVPITKLDTCYDREQLVDFLHDLR